MAYTIEEEQEINEIKNWWKENAKTIIISLIVAVGGTFGWRYWQDHQLYKAQELSAQYDQIVYGDSKDSVAKNAQIDVFVKANEKTGYATFALLDKAKIAVDNQDFALAEEALKQAVAQAPNDVMASIAVLRLATVQFQQKQFDAALSSLNQLKDQTWNSRKALLIGDIQLAKGDKAAAKASYEQAKEGASTLERQWLQVRLNNL
ncbi:MAG TPA: hypothetical protein DD638_03310 [Pasteurellaceae bacterium]|nr:hypothetical protein [Pasteurellaceae bacterium]